jgi:hypothetical protein
VALLTSLRDHFREANLALREKLLEVHRGRQREQVGYREERRREEERRRMKLLDQEEQVD